MTAGALWRLVAQSLRRERRGAALSAFGVAVGVGALVFFVALGQGVGRVIRRPDLPRRRADAGRGPAPAGPGRAAGIRQARRADGGAAGLAPRGGEGLPEDERPGPGGHPLPGRLLRGAAAHRVRGAGGGRGSGAGGQGRDRRRVRGPGARPAHPRARRGASVGAVQQDLRPGAQAAPALAAAPRGVHLPHRVQPLLRRPDGLRRATAVGAGADRRHLRPGAARRAHHPPRDRAADQRPGARGRGHLHRGDAGGGGPVGGAAAGGRGAADGAQGGRPGAPPGAERRPGGGAHHLGAGAAVGADLRAGGDQHRPCALGAGARPGEGDWGDARRGRLPPRRLADRPRRGGGGGDGRGIAGTLAALCGALAVDRLAGHFLPDFPFRPDSYFAFPAWLLALGVGLGLLAALGGAFLPSRRAAALDPARTLAG